MLRGRIQPQVLVISHLGRDAAVDGEAGSGDETGFGTREVGDHRSDLRDLGVTSDCNFRFDELGW